MVDVMRGSMKATFAVALAALALCFPARAAANPMCRTQAMDNGRMSYTYCNGFYADGTPFNIVTTCINNHCTTRNAQ